MDHTYDIAIIGGGPVGMFAAFYAGLRSADVLLLEGTAQLGGQPAALYQQKQIYDVAGFYALNGRELTTALTQQLARFQPDVRLNTRVSDFAKDGENITLNTNNGSFQARSVIIATGAGAFAPRQLAASYDHALDGKRVFYTVPDLNAWTDQDVVIAGGGDTAIDWALALEPIARSVQLVHRRQQFRGLESSVQRLESSSVQLNTPYLIDHVDAADQGIDIILKPVRGAEPRTLHADKLLVSYGFSSDNRQLRAWNLELDHSQIVVDRSYRTNQELVYAIGDAITYPDKQKLIASGFGEAPSAVNSIMNAIHPERRQPLHSSQMNL
ncbi:NAD(P)/FAD-dependent oxidoreductase [Lacticaseibacillus zhaodongensis]|uniref:NAD(P)/FAD-dependent oxidoreductase n=1 Tax=Lacticaseibacillus zhaodongensis TaxID=2668065 RepID=UPI0012D306C7|nr:NAD(P)/FAD-dependent oxidoreductase [Lacticaseibacillus zhaodongensis]